MATNRKHRAKIFPLGLVWTMTRQIETHKSYTSAIRTGQERLKFERGERSRTALPWRVSVRKLTPALPQLLSS